MELIIKGTKIPMRKGLMKMMGEDIDHLVIEGSTVWEMRKFQVTIITSTSFTIPEKIKLIHICGCGAGGGGGSSSNLGGSAGALLSDFAMDVVPGDVLTITIGEGGDADTDGEDSKIGNITLAGGTASDYPGDGAPRTTCGGTYKDGLKDGSYSGGQAGGFGNGGNGAATGSGGSYGAGGGSGATGGKGGGGKIVIYWY